MKWHCVSIYPLCGTPVDPQNGFLGTEWPADEVFDVPDQDRWADSPVVTATAEEEAALDAEWGAPRDRGDRKTS